jgi:hypothetical protein
MSLSGIVPWTVVEEIVQAASAVRGLGSGALARGPWPSLLVNAACPWATYQLLTAQGVATVPALAITAVFPVAGTLLGWARARRPEVVGLLSSLLIGLSLVVALATDDPFVILLRGSVSNIVFGVLCFGSLALARPLMFYVARQFAAGADQVAAARFDAQWQHLGFRGAMRRITAAWGCWLLAEAAGRALAVLLLPMPTFLATWPVVANVGTFAMIYWSMTYGRRTESRTASALGEHSPLLSDGGRATEDGAPSSTPARKHGGSSTTTSAPNTCWSGFSTTGARQGVF